jgi:hypothetical protein
MKQRDKMRELFKRYPQDEEKVIREYALSEQSGEVLRESDEHQIPAIDYARGLLGDGKLKGWIYEN